MPKFLNLSRIVRLIAAGGAVDNVSEVLAHRVATEDRLATLEARFRPVPTGAADAA